MTDLNKAADPWPVWSLGVLLLAFAAMYLPTYGYLASTSWLKDENGHGPLVLIMSLWLLWRERHALFAGEAKPAVVPAFGALVLGSSLYVIGHSQGIDTVDAASQIFVLAGLILLLRGWRGLRVCWFPLFFLLFMVPLPGVLVQTLTLPLKWAVSYLAEILLHVAGYPVGRSGVTLTVGQYQLLVADACAGLNSMFTLESLGLFYMKIMDYQSRARNTILAIMIIPISFVANVVRVLVLVLVTYHLGDEAGQGFLHGFAGMVLFGVALSLTYLFDRFLAARFDETRPERRVMMTGGVQ